MEEMPLIRMETIARVKMQSNLRGNATKLYKFKPPDLQRCIAGSNHQPLKNCKRSFSMKRLLLLPLLLAMTLILAACPAAETPAPAAPAATATPVPVEPTPEPEVEEPMAEMNIVETAIAAGNFTTLVAAVEAAGLVEALSGEGPFTVFAPTDEAFAALPEGTVEALLADPSGDLTQILLYHVISGQVMAADVTDGLEAETLQGSTVTFMVMADGVMINEANIVATDIETSNGVIHVIDAVILPPAGEEAAAEEAAAEATPEAAEEAMEEATAEMNIVETAIAAGSFTTLVAAVEAAGLVEALSGEGPFTVFAPTDEAFAALPEGTVEALLADPSGDLTQILLYHVISGQVMAADVTDGLEAETLQGAPVTFMVMADGVMINEANIVATDIVASNGVIHVIDAVILPPTE
jgi:transforming growth factor-beta-induced protein